MDKITAPRGTQDVLPDAVFRWQVLEEKLRETAAAFGFTETRFPTFEHTELFSRGVGETTDVVQKEMYTFEDKGGRSITLRPEGTASVVRTVLEHGLYAGALPLKLFYIIPCFRYEKPQAGRLREFHQFGVELFGAGEPEADIEIIALGNAVFEALGIKGITLAINSIGCKECRAEYRKALREYYGRYKDELCETCLSRLDKNPMRLLDCKSPVCGRFKAGAPRILDYLCEDCRAHFESVKKGLDGLGIAYTVDPGIVRGLDYYNGTVFEFLSGEIGAQSAVLAGGRYDGLAEELGGPHLPGMGFAMGLERLLLLMENTGAALSPPPGPDLYIAALGERGTAFAASAANELRRAGKKVVTDLCRRSLKAQMKYAGKLGCRKVLIVGDEELDKGELILKDMESGEQEILPPDQIIRKVKEN